MILKSGCSPVAACECGKERFVGIRRSSGVLGPAGFRVSKSGGSWRSSLFNPIPAGWNRTPTCQPIYSQLKIGGANSNSDKSDITGWTTKSPFWRYLRLFYRYSSYTWQQYNSKQWHIVLATICQIQNTINCSCSLH